MTTRSHVYPATFVKVVLVRPLICWRSTVNLSGRVSHIQVPGKMSQGSLLPNAADAADFRPDVGSLGPGSSVLSSSDMIAAEVEQVIDLIVGGEEARRLAGRFKLLHLPLSSACRLVRIFGSVVQSLVLAMLNAGHDLSFGRAVAGKLVGDHDAWRSHLLLQQLAQ